MEVSGIQALASASELLHSLAGAVGTCNKPFTFPPHTPSSPEGRSSGSFCELPGRNTRLSTAHDNPPAAAHMQRAMQLYRQGSVRDAAAHCEAILKQQASHFDALHLLAVIHLQGGQAESGLQLVEKAIEQRPGEAVAHLSRGHALITLGQPKAALEAYDRALALQPRNAAVLSSRGNALLALGRASDALLSLDESLALAPNNAVAHGNRGRALLLLERAADALASHERALFLDPRLVECWTNKGNALLELHRPEEALACYDRALQLRPGFINARHNRCQALLLLRRADEALDAIDVVLQSTPHDPKALLARGSALLSLARRDDAIEHLRKALDLVPEHPDLLTALANAQMGGRHYEEAAQTFSALLRIDPEYEYARGSLCDVLLQRCDWQALATHEADTLAAVRAGKRSAPPFTLMALQSDAAEQAICARAFVERAAPAATKRTPGRSYRHDRVRLAYVSPDFREHPVANQVVRLLETHDRSRFEVIAVGLERQDTSDVAKRVRAGCDRFLDVSHHSEKAIAELLRGFEVDIAIDLSGHTFGGRIGVFAHRAAPVQINYLGYPGTTATACHDYIVADRWVVPEEHEAHYTERVVRLPHSYQPYDPRVEATVCPIDRAEAGLPADAFVFCCFNNRFKIHPGIFDVWTRILTRVPGSVLWLGESGRGAAQNLRREAQSRGVAPDRLIFAERMDSRDLHIARYQLADLFLDTLPFNAHATASDALWAGLPLLTCVGRAFAGRVAAGMLSAVELPELITQTLQQYEDKAVSLAQPGSELSQMRERLVSGRATHALFDLGRYRRGLEQAYERMIAEAVAGRSPCSFAITDCG